MFLVCIVVLSYRLEYLLVCIIVISRNFVGLSKGVEVGIEYGGRI